MSETKAYLPRVVKDWLTAKYLFEYPPGLMKLSNDNPPEYVVCVLAKEFADFLIRQNISLSPNLDEWTKAGWIIEMAVKIAPPKPEVPDDIVLDPKKVIKHYPDGSSVVEDTGLPRVITQLNLPPGTHRLLCIRQTIFDAPTEPPTEAPAPASQAEGEKPRKPKRSTVRGEARAKLIAALTKHHRYADGDHLNQEPISNNELARLARVSPSTASAFFNDEFRGHTKYKVVCRNARYLMVALKKLNDEFAVYHLLGDAARDVAAIEEDEEDSEKSSD